MRGAHAFNPIRSLESALRLVTKAPLPIAVGGLILVSVQGFSGLGWHFSWNPGGGWPPALSLALLAPLAVFGFGASIALMAAVSWLSIGFYGAVEEVMYRGNSPFERLFDPRGRWLSMFLTRLLQGLLIFLSLAVLAIAPISAIVIEEVIRVDDGVAIAIGLLAGLLLLPVFLYLVLGLVLAPYVAALEDIGPAAAIARSWKLARGNRWMLVLFGLGSAAIAFVGLLLCFVGLLPASILIEVMWAEAYVRAVRGEQADGWWVATGIVPGEAEPVVEAPAAAPPPREVPVEPEVVPPPPEPPPPPGEAASAPDEEGAGPFDPGAWRDEAGIPPIDEDPKG